MSAALRELISGRNFPMGDFWPSSLIHSSKREETEEMERSAVRASAAQADGQHDWLERSRKALQLQQLLT